MYKPARQSIKRDNRLSRRRSKSHRRAQNTGRVGQTVPNQASAIRLLSANNPHRNRVPPARGGLLHRRAVAAVRRLRQTARRHARGRPRRARPRRGRRGRRADRDGARPDDVPAVRRGAVAPADRGLPGVRRAERDRRRALWAVRGWVAIAQKKTRKPKTASGEVRGSLRCGRQPRWECHRRGRSRR